MTQPTVTIRNLTKQFDDMIAVDNLSLDVKPGQFVALLGPSGCGKTTSLRMLAGFETPDSGIIEICGRQVNGPNLFVPPEKRRVGMVFQSYALFPHLTIGQNIAYGLSRQAIRAGRVNEALEMVRLPKAENRMPHELSGGQQQRVALARALAPNPDLILLDEPFSNLDAGLRVAVRREVRDILSAVGATAVFVTHDQEEALSLSDQVAVMIDGKLEQVAPPQQLYQRPNSKRIAAFMGDANFLPGTAQGGAAHCEFGQLPALPHLSGPVEIMLRPEALSLNANKKGQVTIVERQFFGHDQLLTCISDLGSVLNVRLSGLNNDFDLGQRVDIILPSQAVLFPGP